MSKSSCVKFIFLSFLVLLVFVFLTFTFSFLLFCSATLVFLGVVFLAFFSLFFWFNSLSTKDTCIDTFWDFSSFFIYFPFTLLYPFLFKSLFSVCGFMPNVEAISSKEMPLSWSFKNSSILWLEVIVLLHLIFFF